MAANNSQPLRIAVLISGRGSNLRALYQAITRGNSGAQIGCVLASSPAAAGLAFAQEKGIPAALIDYPNPPDEAKTAASLRAHLAGHAIDFIVLAGFLRKIPPEIVKLYENRIINVHPALLPAFGGQGMYGRHVHEAVLAYGCKISGATVHLVTEEYDAGPPILQECVPVLPDDTPETLAARVLELEHRLLPRAVGLFARGMVKIEGRRVTLLSETLKQ